MVLFEARVSKEVPDGCELRVSGSCDALGAWDPRRALPMARTEADPLLWRSVSSVAVVSSSQQQCCRYKYALFSASSGALLRYEALDAHRTLPLHCGDVVATDAVGDVTRFLPAWLAPDEAEIALTADPLPLPLQEGSDQGGSAFVVRRTLLRDVCCGREWPLRVGRGAATRVPLSARPALFVEVACGGAVGVAVVGSRELLSTRRGVVVRPAIAAVGGSGSGSAAATAVLCDVSVSFLLTTPLQQQQQQQDAAALWDLSLLRGTRPRFRRFIGHRGSGATSRAVDPEKKHAALAENTLASFVQVGRVPGAGGVEFDVHLTADGVPVVYHDMAIPVALAQRRHALLPAAVAALPHRADRAHVLNFPVNKLALADFVRLGPGKRHEAKAKKMPLPPAAAAASEKRGSSEEDESDGEAEASHSEDEDYYDYDDDDQHRRHHHRNRRRRPQKQQTQRQWQRPAGSSSQSTYWERAGSLPTLEEMFTFVPESTGFDVEIKYADARSIETDLHPFERNRYLDRIISTVLQRCPASGPRWLFYSSFDVDICTMLSRKQAEHDVFLLTIGTSDQYADTNRVSNLEKALVAASEIGLRGVVTNSRAVLADLSVIGRAHALGLVLISWGHENGSPDLVRTQLNAGLDGIISDFLERVAFIDSEVALATVATATAH